ncbi:hypothetical protein MTP99_002619 [Tenebrio molitor]|nr:hypothetical protein MTP99_002619 [Tenebrio molitor]
MLNLWNVESWKNLLESLKVSEYLIKTDKRKDNRKEYLVFGAVTLLHAITRGYAAYVRCSLQVEGFLYRFLLCVMANMLRMRCKGLRLRICNFLKEKSPVCDKNFLDFLDWVESAMNLLKNTVQIYNRLFGGSIFWIISFRTFHILNYTYNLLYNSFLYNLSHLVTSVLPLFCHSVTREAERIVSLCYGREILSFRKFGVP